MKPRLYLDEDVNPQLCSLIEALGYDCVAARDANMLAASDEEHLARANAERRVILTYNYVDFERIATEAAASDAEHAGIIISYHQYTTDELPNLARKLHGVLEPYTADDLRSACLKI